METKKGRVLMAMSGGVDSSVAAALLLEEGYEVIGITMRLWDEEVEKPAYSRTCCAIDDVNDARRVAEKLGIAHYTLNLKNRFKGEVVGDFIEELGRYRPGVLRCDPAVQGLSISGAFRIDDTDTVLENLSKTLPVKVRYVTRYWASIEPV